MASKLARFHLLGRCGGAGHSSHCRRRIHFWQASCTSQSTQGRLQAKAKYLLVEYHAPDFCSSQGTFILFECTFRDQGFCLVQSCALGAKEHSFPLQMISWLPDSNVLCVQSVRRADSPYSFLTVHASRQELLFKAALQASSSSSRSITKPGRLDSACSPGYASYNIVTDVLPGWHIWQVCFSDLAWSGLTEQQRNILQGLSDSLCCQVWAPSGVGPVCSTPGVGDPRSSTFLPPALRFYSHV